VTDGVRPRRVLGLDLGTRCGWALATSVEVAGARSGVWNLQEGDHELPGARLLVFTERSWRSCGRRWCSTSTSRGT